MSLIAIADSSKTSALLGLDTTPDPDDPQAPAPLVSTVTNHKSGGFAVVVDGCTITSSKGGTGTLKATSTNHKSNNKFVARVGDQTTGGTYTGIIQTVGGSQKHKSGS